MRIDTTERINRNGYPVKRMVLSNGKIIPASEESLQSEIEAKALPEIPTECPYGIAQECPFADYPETNESHQFCIACALRESLAHGIHFNVVKKQLITLGYNGPKTLALSVEPEYYPVECASITPDGIHPTRLGKRYAVVTDSGIRFRLPDSIQEKDLFPGVLKRREY